MSARKSSRAAKAQARSPLSTESAGYAGSIADRLERSPGGIEGALARLKAATATGRPMTALEKFAASIGEALPAIAHQPQPDDPATWPVVWRVVIPAAGSYDQDMVLAETESETEARDGLVELRKSGWPVRLERVQCGPLPTNARAALVRQRALSQQNPGTSLQAVAGHWEATP